MKQVLVNDSWESPPLNANIEQWLNEIIAVELNMKLLMPERYIRRFEMIRAIRESSRHKAKPVKIVRSL